MLVFQTKLLFLSKQECCGCELLNHDPPPSFEKRKEESTAGPVRPMVLELAAPQSSKHY